MAEEVQELVVRMTPEGMSETTDDLEHQQETFEETADTVGDQTGLLEDFSQRWRGAAGVIVAGLATLAAGLLSQLPIIGQVFSALRVLFRQFVLLIDEQLRPLLTPVINGIINLATALGNVEGPLGDLVSTAALFVGIFSVLAVVVGVIAGGILAIAGAAAVAGVSLGTLITVAAALTAALAVISGVLTAFVVAWNENWLGIQQTTSTIIELLTAALTGDLGRAYNLALTLLAGFIKAFGSLFVELAGAVMENANQLAARLLTAFDGLWTLLINSAKRFGNRLVRVIQQAVNQAIQAVPPVIRARLGLSTVNIPQPFAPESRGEALAGVRERGRRRQRRGRQRAERGRGALEKQLEQLVTAIQNQQVEVQTNLDSQSVAEETAPFSDQETGNRGRLRR